MLEYQTDYPDAGPDTNRVPDGRHWTACGTLRELEGDRPPISAWLRHLAYVNGPDAVPV